MVAARDLGDALAAADVVVYDRARQFSGNRQVCVQPVFQRGASDTENSLIGTANSMVVENNYGYTGPTATTNGASTAPGIERIDISGTGTGCAPVWYSDQRAPSAVPKLSLANGLVYAYTKPPRSDRTTGPVPEEAARQVVRTSRSSLCIGISRPLPFFAAWSRSSIAMLIAPLGSSTMSHVKLAISPARSPAFADSSTMTRFRLGLRVAEA